MSNTTKTSNKRITSKAPYLKNCPTLTSEEAANVNFDFTCETYKLIQGMVERLPGLTAEEYATQATFYNFTPKLWKQHLSYLILGLIVIIMFVVHLYVKIIDGFLFIQKNILIL